MDLKNIKNEGNQYVLRIDDEIGEMIIGKEVAREIRALEASGVSEIVIKINSVGGSVFDGYTIYNAMLESKMVIKVEVLYAFSIASVIALAADIGHLQIHDYGMMMIHNPSLGDLEDEELTDEQRVFLNQIKQSLLNIYTNRTSLDVKQISDWMDEEKFFSAEELSKYKIVDNVITSKRAVMANMFVDVINRLQKNTNSMKKENIKNELDNKEIESETKDIENVDTTEENLEIKDVETNEEAVAETEDIVEDIEADIVENEKETEDEVVNEEVEALKLEIVNLKELLTSYKTKDELALENKVADLLEPHKANLSVDEYSKWINIAKTDFDFVKSNFDKQSLVNRKSIKISDKINIAKDDSSENLDIHEMSMTDPDGLKAMKKDTPTLYASLFEKTYGVKYQG